MNRYAWLLLVLTLLTSCTGQSVKYKVAEHYPRKNPTQVHFYSLRKEPIAPYKIIGIAKIAKYNLIGVKRNRAQLNEMMKRLAAEMGGDGVLDFEERPLDVKAHIIAYQRILL